MEIYILFNVLLIISYIYILYKSKHAIHMLQLESYKNERYLGWIKKNKKIAIKELILILPSILLCFNLKIGLIANIAWIIFLIVIRNKYSEKKPLVITTRIKRVYFAEIILLIILGAILNIFKLPYIIIALNLLIIFTYIFILVINTINLPIEKNVQKKYYNMAKKKLNENKGLKIIGITGSYGKTSTKYIVGTLLSQKYNTLITPESYNTTMGVVRTINEKLNSTHQIFVCEMGAKNIGDIKEICDLVEPTFGILTAIGPQHLETFKTLGNVKKTKMELIESLPKEGKAFVNFEDENINKVEFDKNTIKFGLTKESDYYAKDIEINEFGSSFQVHLKDGKEINVKTKLLGIYNIVNIVGAVAVCRELGLSEEEIIAGIRFLKPVTHRLELKRNPNGSIIIDDAYNSNVKGAKMALDVLANFKDKKRILITPGIVDLGDKLEEFNKNLGKQAAKCSDYIILVGEKAAKPILEGVLEEKYNKDNLYVAKDLTDAINKMNSIIDASSVVLFENDLPDNYL